MFLTYHQIERQFSSHVYGVTVETLREHVAMVVAHSANGGALSSAVITFDDGHISNYELALPVLQEHGARATFFIPASFVGKASDVMSSAQLRELSSLGHEVASHSWSHPVLTRCSATDLMDELVRSRETLENIIGSQVKAISMPHGSWNARVIAACREAGYTRAYTSDFRRGESVVSGITVCGRLTVRRTMTAGQVGEFLDARGIKLWSLAAPYIAKDAIKGMLGHNLYHKLWKQTLGRKRNRHADLPAASAAAKDATTK